MPEGNSDQKISVFISHKTEDKKLAEKVSDKLKILSENKLKPFLCYEIPGGAKYQDEIESEIRNSGIFILLYTHQMSQLRWLLFETGLFIGSTGKEKKNLICIKSRDTEKPPDILDNLQAYNSDVEGIEKFLSHLLFEGKFTNGKKLNEELFTGSKNEFEKAIQEIESEFSASITATEYFSKRICIEFFDDKEKSERKTEIENAVVTGNEQTCALLSIENNCPWASLYSVFQKSGNQKWLDEIECTISSISECKLPQQFMTPFVSESSGARLTPILSRVEKKLNKTQRLFVIFIETDLILKEAQTVDNMFSQMPPDHQAITRLISLCLHMRWNIIEPFYSRLTTAQEDEIENIIEELKNALLAMEDAGKYFGNISLVTVHFPVDDIPQIEKAIKRYINANSRLGQLTSDITKNDIFEVLDEFRWCNKLFLSKATGVCAELINKLQPIDM